jgi:hypothetical protein
MDANPRNLMCSEKIPYRSHHKPCDVIKTRTLQMMYWRKFARQKALGRLRLASPRRNVSVRHLFSPTAYHSPLPRFSMIEDLRDILKDETQSFIYDCHGGGIHTPHSKGNYTDQNIHCRDSENHAAPRLCTLLSMRTLSVKRIPSPSTQKPSTTILYTASV